MSPSAPLPATGGDICHYCGKRPGTYELGIDISMYGNVKQSAMTDQLVHQTWDKIDLKIPRCASCRTIHDGMDATILKYGLLALGAGAAVIAIVIILAVVLNPGDVGVAIVIVASGGRGRGAGGPIGFAGGAAARAVRPEGVKNYLDFGTHPPVSALVAKGWQFGDQPGVFGIAPFADSE